MNYDNIVAKRVEHIEKLFDYLGENLKEFGLDSIGNDIRTLGVTYNAEELLELKLKVSVNVPNSIRKL